MTNVATDEPGALGAPPTAGQAQLASPIDPLLRITRAIETAATLDELLLLSLHELTRHLRVERGGVALLADGAAILACEYPPQVSPPGLALDDIPSVAEAIRTRTPRAIRCANWESYPPPVARLLRAREVRTALALPLVAQDRSIGVMVLGASDAERVFTPDDIAIARVLAGQVAAAVTAFRINEAAQRRSRELSTLNEIAATITSTLDTREVYRLVVQQLNQYFRVEAGSLLLRDELTGDLEFVMTIEGGEEKLAGVRVPAGQGVVGHVVRSGTWEIVPDVDQDPRFYRKVSEDAGFKTRSILCVPMVAKGLVIGAVELLNKLDGPFSPEDAERLLRMAAFIAVAIENAHLFQQVADGRDRLAAILNSTADGILMADMHGVVLTANPMAARICDCGEAALIGRPLDDVLAGLADRAHEVQQRPWAGASSDNEDDAPATVSELALNNARRRFVRLLRMPVRDERGAAYGQLLVLRDITQEKELEQLREDYTNMLVHDLRAPLTSIMNGVMMVQRGLSGPVSDQQRQLLAIAYQGSQAMLELINNLLDISKMEQGQMALDVRPLSPYVVVDKAIERLRASAASARVEIDQSLELGLPLIEADEDKIVRVLQNLLDNAIKFSRSGATVTLGARYVSAGHQPAGLPLHNTPDHGVWLVIWVQDHGIGIPPAYFARIFEKFGQVRGRKVRGTGLGLTFCRLAVEAHSGRIWVESEEGKGSTFAFALPLALE